jgi:hypothetical protein
MQPATPEPVNLALVGCVNEMKHIIQKKDNSDEAQNNFLFLYICDDAVVCSGHFSASQYDEQYQSN